MELDACGLKLDACSLGLDACYKFLSELGAWSLALVACCLSAWRLSNSRKNLWQLATYAAGSLLWSSVNHGIKLLLSIFLFIVSFLLCLVPVHGDELCVYSYRGLALLMPPLLRWLHISAGLSFKSGYQQTGYHHPILSYGDVKYYYCLELGACNLESF